MEDADEGNTVPISGSEIGMAVKAAGWLRRKLGRPEPATILAHRRALREEIQQNLSQSDHGEAPEVFIVNYKRYDQAGELDTRVIGRGVSDSFKVEVKEPADRGLEVYLDVPDVTIRRSKARKSNRSDGVPAARKAWVVGRIPYERIRFIEWDPRDPNYGLPRFYVEFGWRRNPYREVVLYDGEAGGHKTLMEGVKYLGEGGGPIRRLGRFVHRVRFNVADRRDSKRWRRERYDSK